MEPKLPLPWTIEKYLDYRNFSAVRLMSPGDVIVAKGMYLEDAQFILSLIEFAQWVNQYIGERLTPPVDAINENEVLRRCHLALGLEDKS